MVILLYTWLILPILSIAHPYYVCVTEVEYRSREKELSLSCKFYTDDFEEALKTFSKENTDLHNGNKINNQTRINTYIIKHLKLDLDAKSVQLHFIGYENDNESTWCYFEAENVTPFNKIDIEADLLYETKKEQVILVHVTIDGNRKSNKLSNPDKKISLRF
jgi:hypothetical protein